MQLQGQAIGSAQLSRTYSAQRPYRYFWNCWSRILREEGVLVLYRGLSPALLRQSVYGTIKFGLYPNLKSRFPDLLAYLGFPQKEKGRESLFVNVCCSMIAGAVSSAVATPFDVLKVWVAYNYLSDLTSLYRPDTFITKVEKRNIRAKAKALDLCHENQLPEYFSDQLQKQSGPYYLNLQNQLKIEGKNN